MDTELKFKVGDIVHHLKFDYRGVVYDMDAEFAGTEAWYAQVAKSRPPKDKPWYHVLVDGSDHTTYVAERHLGLAKDVSPLRHPQLTYHFAHYENGRYVRVYH